MRIVPKSDDGSLPADHTLSQWAALFVEASNRFGKPLTVVDDMKQNMADAGFEEVTEVRYKVPVGPWPSDAKLKELGRWDLVYCDQGCEGWALFLLTHVMGVCCSDGSMAWQCTVANVQQWNVEDVKELVSRYKEALRDPKVHSYFEL